MNNLLDIHDDRLIVVGPTHRALVEFTFIASLGAQVYTVAIIPRYITEHASRSELADVAGRETGDHQICAVCGHVDPGSVQPAHSMKDLGLGKDA